MKEYTVGLVAILLGENRLLSFLKVKELSILIPKWISGLRN